jgi:gluconate 2-dehydrogenase gamma chain
MLDGPHNAEPYLSLGPSEAQFVEALIITMCPADELTPDGVTCGLAVFIDRQLSGSFGKGERLYLRGPWRKGKPQHGYQLPLTPEQHFKAGIAAAERACMARHGKRFASLTAEQANAFLQDVAAANVSDPDVSLQQWFNELVYPLFTQACFADPVYGGNRDKVFWTMLGYPGLPATHARDIAQFRDRAYPGAKTPKSMNDFA